MSDTRNHANSVPDCTSAQQILETQDLELRRVEVPEWKLAVYLRTLPADEGVSLSDTMQALPKERKTDALYLLLGACLVTAEGKRLFLTEEQACQQLRGRNHKVLTRLQQTALELQGWRRDAPEKNG